VASACFSCRCRRFAGKIFYMVTLMTGVNSVLCQYARSVLMTDVLSVAGVSHVGDRCKRCASDEASDV
jgi:hypothetical protein